MRLLPYAFILIAGGLSLATFLTSQTLHAGTSSVDCKRIGAALALPG